jgi:hypothetical protein
MTKTRKGGLKHRTRRLKRLLFELPYSPVLGTELDYAGDTEYENYFAAKPACKAESKPRIVNIERVRVTFTTRESRTFMVRRFCYRLTPIREAESPSIPAWKWIKSIRKDDPRRAAYIRRRAEILHQFFDAPPPAHWGTADHPLELD